MPVPTATIMAITALELQLQEDNGVSLVDADPIAVAFRHQCDTSHLINNASALEPNDA